MTRGHRGANSCEVPPKQKKTLLSPLPSKIQTAMNSLLKATKTVVVNTDKLWGLSRLFFMPKKKNLFPFSPTNLFITKKLWSLVNWARPI